MEFFVTGATGFMGTKLVKQLIDDGHDVTALTRSRSNGNHLPDEVTVVEGDITNKSSMREPMTGADRLFHMAAWWFIGPGPRNRESAHRINVEGTRNVLELMDELDISKGVYTSTVGVYGNTDGAVVDESYRPDPPELCVYFNTKWHAHYEVAQPMMEDDDLPLIVVQPGGVYGPDDKEYGSIREIFRNWLQGDLPMIPKKVALPFDHVEDIVRGHLLAMEAGKIGEEYIISSEPRKVVEIFDLAEELTGISAPWKVSPLWFKLLEKVMTPVEWVMTPPEGFEPEKLRTYGGAEILVDNSKATRELGIEHRPIEDGLREYLEWEIDQLGIESQTTSSTLRTDTADTVR